MSEHARAGGRPPVANPKKEWPTAQAHFTPEELRFIDEAAFKLGKKRADYVRLALRRDAAHVLKRKAPPDPA